jgi:hypothetical protein
MAFVAISQNLLGDVDRRLRNMRQAEVSAAPEEEALLKVMIAEPILEERALALLWASNEDLKDRLAMYNTNGYVRFVLPMAAEIQEQYPTVPNGSSIEAKVLGIHVSGGPGFKPLGSYSGSALDIGLEADAEIQALPSVVAFQHARMQQLEITYRWKNVIDQVLAFLKSAKSLNEAVKLWPDAARYIPKEYMDRMAKKVDAKKPSESDAAEKLKSMNIDMVNASHVLARMAGGK